MEYNGMEYRYLGNTGLLVSCVSYGNWLTGHKDGTQERTNEVVKRCWELGVNFFDTAEIYGAGQSEIQLGNAFKSLNVPREQIVVSTKILFADRNKRIPNTFGLSRKHIVEAVNNSLQRLQLDYVDVIFAHRPDNFTPMEEICRAFNHVIEQGKAFYWGTSEWNPDQIIDAYRICDKLGLIQPIVEQPQYNMFVRKRFEQEYAYIFDNYKMGTTIWSPLLGGILTGKYNQEIPDNTRLAGNDPDMQRIYGEIFLNQEVRNKQQEKLKALGEIAKELGITQAQLALAWCIVNKDVSTAIFGATSLGQVDDNVKAVSIYKNISSETWQKIEKILDNKPQQNIDFRKWAPFQDRR